MKRFALVAACLVLTMLLSSCTALLDNPSLSSLLERILPKTDRTIAQEEFDAIWDTIETQDTEKLLGMFSPNVRQEVPDLAEQINELFELVEGNFLSQNNRDAIFAEDYFAGDGSVWKYIQSTHDVETDKGVYRLSVIHFVKNTEDPEELGIYSICVRKVKYDLELSTAYWGLYHENDDKSYRNYDPGITFDESY